ncbi:MAG: AAA family ATPase, partial [Planctomycetota bacterium]|nr:AAA family ATPase [Planctomycetota bacterium]
RFELAVEAAIPDEQGNDSPRRHSRCFRYELAVGIDPETTTISILAETGLLKNRNEESQDRQLDLFPAPRKAPESIITSLKKKPKGVQTVFSKRPNQDDNYYPEKRGQSGGGGWVPAFKLGPRRSTLANLPEDETRFPAATWFKNMMSEGVQQLILNSLLIRKASPPGQAREFKSDGSNLPWMIHALQQKAPERFHDWIAHLQQALPDLQGIRTVVRDEDRHRYLQLEHRQGFDVPSWMSSDGTLRLLALTLPAYLTEFSGVYLIEEPENGIHPRAVETMFQSLSSAYNAQILMATHSPVILSSVKPEDVLCFAKSDDGATDIVPGNRHPRLKDWKGEETLGVLFAGGVLG